MKISTKPTPKHKDLGIFYTDRAIVDFIYSIVEVWKEDEDNKQKRWTSHKPKPKYPSVIDPAVGEGVFLKEALERGFTDKHHVFGLDLDEDAVEKWKQIHLLKAFGGNEDDLEAHFFHQNGLDKIQWQQHLGSYRYQLKAADIANQQFDLVIGNPPFGGSGLDVRQAADSLIENLREFKIIPEEVRVGLEKGYTDQQSLLTDDLRSSKASKANQKSATRLKSYPIEILFTERFLQLAKPGGWVAIILPDGIFANSNSDYVRRFIARRGKVEAIVSLPRNAFKYAGTNAKTSILFIKKYNPEHKQPANYNVFLGNINKIEIKALEFLTTAYKEYYGGNMANPVQIINDQDSNEQVMVRIDKTLRELMEEKPSSRWNPIYWHPKYESIIETKYDVKDLGAFIAENNVIYRNPPRTEYFDSGIRYLLISNTRLTGIDLSKGPVRFIKPSGSIDVPACRLNKDDILVARSGASIGKKFCFINTNTQISASGDFAILRNVEEIYPEYVYVYLLTSYVETYFSKLKNGVGVDHLNADEIRAIKIPLIDRSDQRALKKRFENIQRLHKVGLTNEADSKLQALVKNLESLISNSAESLDDE